MLGAYSDADIANMALSHLGVSQGIQSIDPPDQSAQAAACAFWYPKARDWLLQSAPWDFANVSIALAADPTVYPGFTYAFQYPLDCLQAVAIVSAYGQTNQSSYFLGPWGFRGGMSLPKTPYKVVQSVNPGMKAIVCNLNPAYLLYIQQVTDTSLFSPMFAVALSFTLASMIGGTLRNDQAKVKGAAQMAAQMRSEALAQALNEQQQDYEAESPSVLARW